MSSRPAPVNTTPDPAEHWNALLRPLLEGDAAFLGEFQSALRGKNLIFGGRIHCPFLRPFFLSPADEERVRAVAETMVELAERVTSAALEDPALLEQFHLDPDEERLVRIHNGYGPASTASRLDAFLLPHTLKFAEYNGESPAGAGYAETLAEVFEALPAMQEFSKNFEVHSYPLSAALLDALVTSYRAWGGTSWPPQMAIVDWREVPTWNEFEILQKRFESLGVPVELADPRTLIFDGKTLTANGKKIDLVYRRMLLNDIVARPSECRALVDAYAARAVCVANHFRCKIPHVKTFFAVLTDERNGGMFSFDERQLIREHVPWTRVVADVSTAHYGEHIDLLAFIRRNRQNLVLKPSDEYGGSGVTLGWETTERVWDTTLEKIISGNSGTWIVQERIPIRREVFPCIAKGGKAIFLNMLVDFAPYLFRGKLCGFLTRLSATGLANVTSGGGQVPAFRVNFRPHE